jgi:pyrimidine deaminase RibD-like protein
MKWTVGEHQQDVIKAATDDEKKAAIEVQTKLVLTKEQKLEAGKALTTRLLKIVKDYKVLRGDAHQPHAHAHARTCALAQNRPSLI